MSSFNCEYCGKEFKCISGLKKHINKKTPCSINLQSTVTESINMSNKNTELINVFKSCFDILRDSEHLVGDKALKNLSYFLALKLIEPQIVSGNIDIEEYFPDMDKKILNYSKFSNLHEIKESNLINNLDYIWNNILSVHPKTKNIFLQNRSFDIKNQSTFKRIIDKLNSFDFSQIEEDILGSAYEDVIKSIMIGKTLGQFFTPPKVKNMMVKLINPHIKPDGTIETIFDPAMGTGGFLISCSRHLINEANQKNITLNWEFISKYGLGGREAEIDTFQLANLNMLISTGHMFEAIDCGDSIRNPIEKKVDIILANPPFGIKGLKYDEITSKNSISRDEYLPIKSTNAVSLFLQAMIYMLNINGRCAVVVPDGKDLFSDSTDLLNVRKYLLKTCDLQEIIQLPNDVFTNTSIKTCVFYFTKKVEGSSVISIQNKGKSRNYNYTEGYNTKSVKFYSYNIETEEKTFISEIDIEHIANNKYSFNCNEYIKSKDKDEVNYNTEIEIKTLGEICTFLSKSKRPASYGNIKGKYPFFKSSMKLDSYVDEPDYTTESIIIGTGGNANIKYSNSFSCSADNIIINSNCVNVKFLYYYLFINIGILEKGFVGSAIKHISKEYIQKIPIPIPSIEKQQEIVDYLDFVYEKCIKTSFDKIEEIKQSNIYYLKNQIKYNKFDIKTLGEVCKVSQGIYIKPEMKIKGNYPVYGGGDISFYINQYNREDDIIISKDGVSINCVRYEKNKFFLNHHGWTLNFDDIVVKKYGYYYLLFNQDKLYELAKGTAQKGINQISFYKLNIPIPSIEKQQEIVQYIEFNEGIINCLIYEVKQNKKLGQEFLVNSLNGSGVEFNFDIPEPLEAEEYEN